MAVFIALVLTVCCLALVTLPFWQRSRRRAADAEADPLAELLVRRQTVFEELRTLKLDFELGNVPEVEYRQRLEVYRLQAAELLREQDQALVELEGLDKEIEEAVKALRSASPTPQAANEAARHATQDVAGPEQA